MAWSRIFSRRGCTSDYHDLIQSERLGLGYKSADCDFFRPALMGDRLQFTVLVEHIGRTSVIFSLHCVREVEEIMRCRLVMVTTSLQDPQRHHHSAGR